MSLGLTAAQQLLHELVSGYLGIELLLFDDILHIIIGVILLT